MTNDEYRAEQAERRQHGLKARHELRLENATYTAAEVKVLTEAALRLGRKEAGEEIAAAIDAERENRVRAWNQWGFGEMNSLMTRDAMEMSARIARDIASQPSPDATCGRTDPEAP